MKEVYGVKKILRNYTKFWRLHTDQAHRRFIIGQITRFWENVDISYVH